MVGFGCHYCRHYRSIAGENGENAINLLAFLANFVLLFMIKRDRRTLYDMMADTVVVKLPG